MYAVLLSKKAFPFKLERKEDLPFL